MINKLQTKHILEHIREFYETLFKTQEQNTAIEIVKNFE